jgi:hypothetical protein
VSCAGTPCGFDRSDGRRAARVTAAHTGRPARTVAGKCEHVPRPGVRHQVRD